MLAAVVPVVRRRPDDLAMLVLRAVVVLLTAFHAITPHSRAMSIAGFAGFAGSLLVVWFGLSLSR